MANQQVLPVQLLLCANDPGWVEPPRRAWSRWFAGSCEQCRAIVKRNSAWADTGEKARLFGPTIAAAHPSCVQAFRGNINVRDIFLWVRKQINARHEQWCASNTPHSPPA